MQRILLSALAGALWITVSYSQNAVQPSLSSHSGKPSPSQTTVSLPPDFPVFVDTGNPDLDRANYKRDKDAWIQANPERYKALMQNKALTEEQLKEKSQKANAKP